MKTLRVLLLLLGACGADDDPADPGGGPPDIRVVVIETNIPDDLDAAPVCPFRYERDNLTRACDDAVAPVAVICSSVELCQVQQNFIFEAYQRCELEYGGGAFNATALPACP